MQSLEYACAATGERIGFEGPLYGETFTGLRGRVWDYSIGARGLTGITRGGQPLQDDDTVTVTCLATEKQMAPLLQDESRAFERGEATVKDAWSEALSGGSVTLAAPESYITFGGGNALWKKLSIK